MLLQWCSDGIVMVNLVLPTMTREFLHLLHTLKQILVRDLNLALKLKQILG